MSIVDWARANVISRPDTIRNIGATFCKITLKYCLLNDVFSFIATYTKKAVGHVSIMGNVLLINTDINRQQHLDKNLKVIKLSLKKFLSDIVWLLSTFNLLSANTNLIIWACVWQRRSIKITRCNTQHLIQNK